MESESYWLSQNFITIVLLITSLFNGLGEGVSQPASGTYISDCATEHNKGFYYALFWAFYMGSQVFGNLIAALVLDSLDQRYYVAIMTCLAVMSCFLFFMLKAPIVQHEHLRKQHIDEHTRSVRS